MVIPDEARAAADTWLAAHDEHAPGLIEGLYLVGSVALGDWRPRSDVDIVAFTAEAATDDDARLLRSAHDAARAELDRTVDGPYLAWTDVTVPPLPLHRPWTLDGEFRHDGDCFEINPVTWYILDRFGVARRGPSVAELQIPTDADDRRSFVQANAAGFWTTVRNQLVAAVDARDHDEFEAELVEWCVLGIARLLCTAQTAEVVSKTAAGHIAIDALPAHTGLIERVIDIRADADPAMVGAGDIASAVEFLDDALAAIARA